MVRAQTRGVIDWSETRFFDKQWWRRSRLLLAEMVAEDTRKLREARHMQAIAYRTAIATGKFEEDAWENASNNVTDRWLELIEAYRPWEHYDREQQEKEQAKQLIGGWESRFGSTDDPEVARKIEELAKAMTRMSEQEAPQVRYHGTLFNARTAGTLPLGRN